MSQHIHELTVAEVVEETHDAMSLVFDVPAAAAEHFSYSPGQFLTLKVPSELTGSVARCYSLSSSPHSDKQLVVTVKRTAGGYASNWICDNAAPGMRITVLVPAGAFTARSLDRDVLLVAGGSGVTPIMSIAKSVLSAGTGNVALLYANRDRGSVIFAERFEQLAREFPDRLAVSHWLEDADGLPTAEGLAGLVAPHAGREVYLCGPSRFMAVVHQALGSLGVPSERIHQEDYKSLADNPFEHQAAAPSHQKAGGNGHPVVEVELDGQTHVLDWPKDKPLLDVLLDEGLDPPYVCRESYCGTCVCSVKAGKVRMVRHESLIEAEIAAGLVLACQSRPETDSVRIAFDQE